jgi:hypothetical protein
MMENSTSNANTTRLQTYSLRWLFLIVFMLFAGTLSFGQLLQQNFTSSTVVADYANATTPTNGQFNAISTSGAGTVLSINTTTSNKLRFARTGNAGAYTRTTDFTGTPTSLLYRFDFTLSANSATATNAATLQIGSGFTTANSTEANASVHSRIGVNFTTTGGQFSLRDIGGSTSSANFTGTQTIFWAVNNSGATLTYRAPDGTFETVANDTHDVWVGTTRVFNDIAALTPTQTLTDIKYVISGANGTTDFDNFLIDPIPAVPTSSAATSLTTSGFTANWSTVAGVTGYRIDVATDAAFTSLVSGYNNLYVSGQATNSLNVTGLNANTTYYYRVRGASQYTVGEFAGGNSSSQSLTTLNNASTDYCNIQFPTSATIGEGETVTVYAQAYEPGLTEAAGAGSGLSAWIGYSSTNSDPSLGGWTWVAATFNTQSGNNDEFKADLGSGLAIGTYYYASRFQINSGPYTYGGTAGNWSSTANNGVLTVTSNVVDFANIQAPTSGTITEGSTYNVYARVYEPGVTVPAGASASITAWIGVSSSNTNPNTWTTWIPATFNAQFGNDDEYVANIASGLAPGTYYYASRFQKTGSTEYRYGGVNGFWNNDSGVLTVNPDVVDFANIQFPASGSVSEGGTLNVYIQAYEPSYTEAGGANAGLTAELGYSSTNSNPNGAGWTWIATTYNTQAGNNDEYVANIAAGLTPGTYYYASRFKKSTSTYYQYGGTNGVWNNDNGVLTITAATPVVSSGSPSGTVGVPFTYSIVASNSPTSFAVTLGTLPSGLSLNTSNGQITGTPTAAGTFVVSVTASNAAGTSTPATLTFTIAQGSQTITFGAFGTATYGDAPIALTATASSGLTVTYSSSDTNVATVAGSTLTIVGVGTATITASQAGDANYTAATSVNQSITVTAKGLTISGITANDKVQDGTTTATLAGTAALVGVVTGDELLVSLSGTIVANFATALPGANQVVTVSGYTLTGTKAANYTLSQPTGLTASITALAVPVATADTNATATSFDANWNAVSGATSYLLDVSSTSDFLSATSSTLASWTFPVDGTVVTPDVASTNNTTKTVTTNGGAISSAAGVTTQSASAAAWQSGSGTKYWQVDINTLGYYSIAVSAAQRSSNTGPKDFKVQYRIGVGSWVDTGTNVTVAADFTTGVTNLVLPSSCDNQSAVSVRWIMTSNVSANNGTVASGGTNRIDNILITGKTPNFLSGYEGLNVGNTTTTNVSGISTCTPYYYRVRSVNGSVISSNSNVITVEAVSIGGTATGDETICDGTQPTAIVLSGSCGSIVKWQSSSDALFTSPVDIASTSATLSGATIGALTATTYFRAVVQNGTRPVAYSNTVTITVTPSTPASVTIVSTATTFCLGTSVTFTATPTNGGTTPSYQWKVNGNNVGTDSAIFTTTALNNSDVVTVVMTSNASPCLTGSPATSNTITVTVNALASATISGTNGPALCSGSDVVFTVTGTTNAILYYNINGGGTQFTVLTGGSATITVTGATATQTLNLVSVDNGICPVTLSESASVAIESTTWDGNGWSNGAPTSTKTAIVTGNLTIASNLEACSLTVTNNAVVSVASGFNVTLQNAITVDSGSTFTVNSNANLIQVNANAVNSGNIVVKRISNPLMRFDYILWGSPVAGQNLFNFSPLTSVNPTVRFYSYNSATNSYSSVANYATHTMNVGQGYLIRLPFNHPTAPATWTGTFTGVPNNGTITQTLANNGAGFRYNAVSNPYPSTLSMAQFYADNVNAIEPTLYYWRKTNSTSNPSYCSYNLATDSFIDNDQPFTDNPNGAIQVGQGFFVEAKDASTSVIFNNGQRIANNANQMFRSTLPSAQTVEKHRIWLNLTGAAGEFSQTMVGYFTGGTLGADATDAKFFNDGTVAFNSKINGVEYIMNGRPVPFDNADIVPMNFKVTTAGTYTIAIDHKDGLFADTAQDVYLKDNETATYHNLNNGPYTFTAQAGVFENRFELVYQNALSTIDQTLDGSAFAVVKSNGKLTVRANTNLQTVTIYDVHGRLITQVTNVNATEVTLPVQVADQVLLVQVTTTEKKTGVKKAL